MPPNWDEKAGFDSVYYGHCEHDGRPGVRDPVRINYTRWKVYPEAEQYASFMDSVTTTADTILVVGSGFAWSLEILVDSYGYTAGNLTGVDTSTYVQGNKDISEEAEIRAAIAAVGLDPDGIVPHPVTGELARGPELLARCLVDARPRATIQVLNENLQNNGSRNRVRNAVGGTIDYCFSELMLSGLTDAEAQLVDGYMAETRNGVGASYHIVGDQDAEGLRWRQVDIDKHGWNIHTLEEWAALMPNSYLVSAYDFRVIAPSA
jgi:hypothetical protein